MFSALLCTRPSAKDSARIRRCSATCLKCGSRQKAKHFAAHLREVVKSNHLPDYSLTLADGQALFHRRSEGATTVRAVKLPSTGEAAPRRVQVSSQALEQLREVAPGWDRYALEAFYSQWVSDKDPARNEDARFLAWARSFTKGRPP